MVLIVSVWTKPARVGKWREIGLLLSPAVWCSSGFVSRTPTLQWTSVPMPASCSRSSNCTCPSHTHSQTILSFIFPSTQTALSEAEAVHAIEQCIRAIRAWMQADKLKLNENKTDVMLIGARQQLSKVNLDTLTVGDTSVAIVNKARNVGVWFDSQLNFNVHITKTCSLSFCSLYKIRRIGKYLSYKSAQTLTLALVIGRLDYCNSLLHGLPASYTNKLQRVQNAAARLISNTTRFDHISPVLIDLHWLPVKYRIMFKLVVCTFKALHGSAPSYIHQLIRLKPQSNYNLRSNTKHLLFDLPNKTKKTT